MPGTNHCGTGCRGQLGKQWSCIGNIRGLVWVFQLELDNSSDICLHRAAHQDCLTVNLAVLAPDDTVDEDVSKAVAAYQAQAELTANNLRKKLSSQPTSHGS